MNRKDIQRFARQARLPQNYMTGESMWLDRLEDFAALVAAAEREACAKVCEDLIEQRFGKHLSFDMIAAAIRARGQA